MAKFINADKFKKDNDWLLDCDFPNKTEETLEELIDNAPAADVEPVRHGWWLNTLFGWKCSACRHVQDYSVYFKRCPNCGARMVGEK